MIEQLEEDWTKINLVYTNEIVLQMYFDFKGMVNFDHLDEDTLRIKDELFKLFDGHAYTLKKNLSEEEEIEIRKAKAEYHRTINAVNKPLELKEETKAIVREMFKDIDWLKE